MCDALGVKTNASNGDEGQPETDVVQIERIDAQHEEEGECAGIDANIFT